MDGAGVAERAPAVAARPAHRDPQAARADGLVGDPAEVQPLHRDDRAEFGAVIGHRLLDAAQVAQPLLAGVGAEEKVGARPQARLVQHARQQQQGGDRQAVVADAGAVESAAGFADRQIGAEWEDGIGVGGEEERAAALRADAPGGDVARRIAERRKVAGAKLIGNEGGALGLLKGRRGDRADLARQGRDRRGALLGSRERRAHRRAIPAIAAALPRHQHLPNRR